MKYSGAVAVVEVDGFPAAIACADAMIKSANVTLLGYEVTNGGKGWVCVKICGDVGAVQAAVDAGCAVAAGVSGVAARIIMPRPHKDLEKLILNHGKGTYYASDEPEKQSLGRQRADQQEKQSSDRQRADQQEKQPEKEMKRPAGRKNGKSAAHKKNETTENTSMQQTADNPENN